MAMTSAGTFVSSQTKSANRHRGLTQAMQASSLISLNKCQEAIRSLRYVQVNGKLADWLNSKTGPVTFA